MKTEEGKSVNSGTLNNTNRLLCGGRGTAAFLKGYLIIKPLKEILETIKKCGGRILDNGEDGFACTISRERYFLCIIVSWGKGWEHVSIHAQVDDKEFTPFWEDMCCVKHLFFKDSETVIQYHPPKAKYVNCHPHTLHLWRPQNQEIVLPPIWMV